VSLVLLLLNISIYLILGTRLKSQSPTIGFLAKIKVSILLPTEKVGTADSLLPDKLRTIKEVVAFDPVKFTISLSLQTKLVKFGKDVISTEPLNFGVEVPQLIAYILLGFVVLIDKLIIINLVYDYN
jgi:hypothetical protein